MGRTGRRLTTRAVPAPWRRFVFSLGALVVVVAIGVVGYVAFGMSVLDALYQTVTTLTTVGFRELTPFGTGEKLFTIGLIVLGVGVTLAALASLVEVVIEGHLRTTFGRYRMDRRIAELEGHVVLCGWGRVGRAIARSLGEHGREFVVIDRDETRLTGLDCPWVLGDATLDETLRRAGIERASSLVAALTADADNLFVTMSGRALAPQLFIVARARAEQSSALLTRGGADRVVNPQEIGGARIAAFLAQPNVAEFLDVVMHERTLDFRIEEVAIPPDSPLAGRSLQEAGLRERTGSLVLALRRPDGSFNTNPDPRTTLEVGHVVIAIGTPAGLIDLERAVGAR